MVKRNPDEWWVKVDKDGIAWLEPRDDEVSKALIGLFMDGLIKIGIDKDGMVVFMQSDAGAKVVEELKKIWRSQID